MNAIEAAGIVSADLDWTGYVPSDNKRLEPCDRVFFGKPCPKKEAVRTCECGGELTFHHCGSYITGQWQCGSCTRLFGATVAETIGALLALAEA